MPILKLIPSFCMNLFLFFYTSIRVHTFERHNNPAKVSSQHCGSSRATSSLAGIRATPLNHYTVRSLAHRKFKPKATTNNQQPRLLLFYTLVNENITQEQDHQLFAYCTVCIRRLLYHIYHTDTIAQRIVYKAKTSKQWKMKKQRSSFSFLCRPTCLAQLLFRSSTIIVHAYCPFAIKLN